MQVMALDWDNLKLHLGSCGRVRCEPGWSLGEPWWRRLQDFDLWLVWAGKGQIRIDDQQFALHPGFCVWMRPGHRYDAEQDTADRLGVNYIHFDLTDITTGERCDVPSIIRYVSDLTYLQSITSRINELSRGTEHERTVALQLLRGVLMDLERPATSQEARSGTDLHHYRVSRAIAQRIREDPSRNWSVAELAEEAGYCSDHFSRVFREVIGQSPREFIVSCRVERAQTLLRETSLSIEAIARALRYSSVFFFSRQFKSHTGISPSQWRRKTDSAAGHGYQP